MAVFLSQLKLPAAMLAAQAHGRPGPPGKDGMELIVFMNFNKLEINID